MIRVGGWHLLAHSLLLDQLDRLASTVAREREKHPETYRGRPNFKLLASLRTLIFETIPEDPTHKEYRQGATLGAARKHWFLAKFGGQRFRLYFRFDLRSKIIIYAWVNDSSTLRVYGAKSDAYAVFIKMLDKGNPPDSWSDLLAEASLQQSFERLEASSDGAATRPTGKSK